MFSSSVVRLARRRIVSSRTTTPSNWTTYSSSSVWGTVQSYYVTKQYVTVRCLSSSGLPSSSKTVFSSKVNEEQESNGQKRIVDPDAPISTLVVKKSNTIRLSKLLSQYATNLTISRRQAERLIHDGEVTLAGQAIRTPQTLLDVVEVASNTVLKVRGKAVQFDPSLLARNLLSHNNNDDDDDGHGSNFSSSDSSSTPQPPPRVWAVHKVAGEVVSERDPHDRPSMMDRLRRGGVGRIKAKVRRGGSTGGGGQQHHQQQVVHLKPIGRLDMPTEGLMLVTNDGDFARQMELPSSQIHRVYRVRVHGQLTSYKLDRIRRGGIQYENVRYSPMKVAVENSRNSNRSASGGGRAGGPRRSSTNTWLQVTSTEGKNRQIRNVFAALGGRCPPYYIFAIFLLL